MSWIKKQFRPYWLQAILVIINTGFVGLLYLHFTKQDISLSHLFLAEFFSVVFITTILIIKRTYRMRGEIMIGFLLYAIAMIVVLNPFSFSVLYAFFILRGLGSIIFFIPYNIIYFSESKKDKNLQGMTWYWAVGVFAGAVAPILGTFLFIHFGITIFLFTALLLAVLAMYLSRYIPKEKYTYSRKEIFTHIKGLRTLNLIDGALHKVMMIVIPLWATRFLTDEIDFGIFLSLMGVVAIFVSLNMAKMSDRLQKRSIFIWPLSIATGIVTGLFFFATSVTHFLILALLLKAFNILISPLRSNIVQDKFEQSPLLWISREVYLNIGRIFMLAIVASMMFLGLEKEIFIFLALLNILFPFVLYFKRVYRYN
ncbi:hypothetical protein HOF40_02855 [Candidatus Parcubacteria bacterium]|jgi:MFS family permease|nr:hypothetical protein [Candidatus Parcubacteria bacterium]MBT3949001.1 hypothetical protein [Candidatus Parcubacteria bacterium]